MHAPRTWRRGWHAAWLAATTLIVILAVVVAAPRSADAAAATALATSPTFRCDDCSRTIAAPLSHTGWTRLNLNYCAPGRICALMYRVSTPAWRWNDRAGWAQTSLRGGQWVYVSPFSGDFRWAWTQETGWLAVSGGRFEIQSTMRTTQPIAY